MLNPRSILTLPIMVLVLGILAPNSTAQLKGYFPKPGPDDAAQDVSLIQLVAQPEKFDGKRVRLIGFLRLEFEGNAIYLHREDFERSISRNGLWINVPTDMTKHQQDEVNMHYVICVGVFRAERHGHMDLFSGEMSDVRRLEVWPWSDQAGSAKAGQQRHQ